MTRLLLLLASLTLAACSPSGFKDLNSAPVPLGDFKLGHNIVVASKASRGPGSRKASEEQLVAAMTKAISERFDRYQGERTYHFGVSIEGYTLAVPGIPLVLSPKSAIIIRVTVWDDAKGAKLNQKPYQTMVLESFSGETALGSGLTQSAEEQLRNLTVNASKQIELYLLKQMKEEGWFKPPSPEAAAEAVAARP